MDASLCQPIALAEALAISEDESRYVNDLYGLIPRRPTSSTPITLILPNYNNGPILEEVLESIVAQEGCSFRLWILDNHSEDGSWQLIQRYQAKHAFIEAQRLAVNTGPHTWGRSLFYAPLAGYVMPCSGNDVLLSSRVVATLAYYLDHSPETVLAYGGELESDQSEPRKKEYTFSVPGRQRKRKRATEAIEALDAFSIATWFYHYSESLWGMYRSGVLKYINLSLGYGVDHVLVSLLAALGGISGFRAPLRRTSTNRGRTLQDLQREQMTTTYTNPGSLATPLEATSFMALAYSYYQGVRDSCRHCLPLDLATLRAISILHQRFPAHFYNELQRYHVAMPMIKNEAIKRDDLDLRCRLAAEHAFVETYIYRYLDQSKG